MTREFAGWWVGLGEIVATSSEAVMQQQKLVEVPLVESASRKRLIEDLRSSPVAAA